MSLLEVEKLNISYNGKTVVKDLTLSLEKGQILGIVGESGSGKSTLLKAIIGLLGDNGRAESGILEFDGIDMLRISNRERMKIRGKRVGMVWQDPGMSFNPIRKIGVQFLEALRAHGKVDRTEAYETILDMFQRLNLRDGERILNSYPFELSGGMNQRVAIALAMIMNPDLLLADEPTSALDVRVQAQCVKEMMGLREKFGTTIIIVTHNMGLASYMADRVAVMCNGKLVEYGDKIQVMNNPSQPYTRALIRSVPTINGPSIVGISPPPPVD